MMTKKLNILFVDDEKQILISLKAMFQKNFNVFTAISGPDALDIIRSNSIQIIVSDQRMPEMLGIDLLKLVKEISPSTVRILLTGYADLNAVMESVNTGEIFRFIEKPWNNERLRKTINIAAKISLTQAGGKHDIESFSDMQGVGILVVDDAFDICAKIHHLFGHQHNVFCANSMQETLTILEAQDIAVLITDTVVKGEEMSTLIHVLKETYPLTLVIVLTTQTDAHFVVGMINGGQIFRYLHKPVETHLLEFSINAALKCYTQFQHEPSLLESQQVEQTYEETPESKGKVAMLKEKLRFLQERMRKFLRI
jgi:serine/threonine-protein kinase